MAEKAGSMLDFMKKQMEQTKEGGGNFNIFFTKDGEPKKVRMLCEIEEALPLKWHQKSEDNGKKTVYDHPCLVHYGKKCPTCEVDERKNPLMQFALTTFEYEFGKKLLMLYKYNKWSPLPSLAKKAERSGTIKDRDFIIEQVGVGMNKMFEVDAEDKSKFDK